MRSAQLACRRFNRSGAAVVVTATLAILVAGTGSAYAYWRTTGLGSGANTTGTVSLTVSVSAGSGLSPGGSVPVSVTVNHTSVSGTFTVQSLLQNGTAAVATVGKGPSCLPSVVTFTAGSLPSPIAHGASGVVSGTVSMSTAAADDCQGATFSIPLQVNGKVG